ncbi:branched-chain amino acid ABC transporter permease [Micromonospora sediminicola]|uniref:branched-chain amino acid ABC transporter permease n=1 Tax=Micromonospora sediminicola TaxID=946078 RepID=UPI003409ED2B
MDADAYLIPVIDGIAYGLLLFTVAAGLTLAFGVGGVLNLAHGTFYAAGAYIAVALSTGSWTSLLIAALAATAVGAGAGAALALAVTALKNRGHLPQALLTFGVALAGGSLLVELFGADELRPAVPTALNSTVTLLGHTYPTYRLAFIAVAAALAAAGWLMVTGTRAGARIRAAADDSDMLASIGVNPRHVTTVVLLTGGALAGLAGALGAPIIGPGPRTAETVLVLSLVVVVVGRLGSIGGAFLAAIAVGQVQSLGVVLLPSWSPYLLFGAMATVLILRRRSAQAVTP